MQAPAAMVNQALQKEGNPPEAYADTKHLGLKRMDLIYILDLPFPKLSELLTIQLQYIGSIEKVEYQTKPTNKQGWIKLITRCRDRRDQESGADESSNSDGSDGTNDDS